MEPKNLRNYSPSQSSGKDAKSSGGPLDGQAVRRTKAENETNEMKEHYTSGGGDKSNLGGRNTGS